MFSLVQFQEDKVVRVVDSNTIGKKNDTFFAPFGKYKYPVDILDTNGKSILRYL